MIRRTPDLDDLDRELRDHIEEETLDNLAKGMTEDEARSAAIRKFGNLTRVKEDVRAVWIPDWLDQLRQDARAALRAFRRSPAFSAALVATLSLGLGLTTTVFSVVNAVLLRPLAFPNPDRLVWLTTRGTQGGNEEMNSILFSEWKAQATSFTHMVAYGFSDATMVLAGRGSRMRIVMATEGFWSITGARAALGTLPAASDRNVIVLAHHAFAERFGSDPSIVGTAVTINGQPAVIGGVLSEDFAPQLPAPSFRRGLEQTVPDAYRGLVIPPAPTVITPTTGVAMYLAFGELRPGVSALNALEEIDTIHARNQRQRAHPLPGGPSAPIVIPLQERLVGASRYALRLLLAAALAVLLITCANVAHLLMARASARQKEIALRLAIGSGPGRVMRLLLFESLTYSIAGAAAGLVFAAWMVSMVIGVIGPSVPRLGETTVDVTAFTFAMLLASTTAVLFGVVPAISLSRTRVQLVLKEGARTASASPRQLMAGRAMLAAQCSLTVILVVAAGLMLKSIVRMTAYAPGFVPQQILTMRVDFRGAAYRDPKVRRDYAAALLDRARALPGVQRASLTTGAESFMVLIKEGQPRPSDPHNHEATVSSVSADFGPMLGMQLRSGRWLRDIDEPGSLVVNEALARQEYPDGEAVGQRLRSPWLGEDRYGTIVGVASNLKYTRLDEDVPPEMFVHFAESPLSGAMLVIQTDGDTTAASPALVKALSAVDPTQSFFSVRTLEAALAELIAPRRLNLLLLSTFALAAFAIAALGIYGVVAYAVAKRTREIGIRLALGAERRRVVRMIVTQAMQSVGLGVLAGLAGALAAGGLIGRLLYGVEPRDLPTLLASAAVLTVVALLACGIPALKAATIDPARALRAE